MKSVTITVEFDDEAQGAYAHMFLRRCGYHEFYDRTEPHLSKEERNERASQMSSAILRIKKALEQARIPPSIY